MASVKTGQATATTTGANKALNNDKITAKQAAATPPTKSELRARATKAPRIVRAIRPAPTQEAISKRAQELWVRRGKINGHAREDWLIAEAELYNGL